MAQAREQLNWSFVIESFGLPPGSISKDGTCHDNGQMMKPPADTAIAAKEVAAIWS